MGFISIDLGTTNIKAILFTDDLEQVFEISETVKYIKTGKYVEFSAEKYANNVLGLIKRCKDKLSDKSDHIRTIVLTGQAESLVVIDKNGKPLRNGISWLDMRSEKECEELQSVFDQEKSYRITGQVSIIPTWPITKILWIKKNEPGIYNNVYKFLLLKDYIQYILTEKIVGEYSIYNFTYYFDIEKKEYWTEILDYCDIKPEQLPQLIEPCTDIGSISTNAAETIGIDTETTVNVGTLDHFAGMIGTGNIREGIISESTGTVLSIATLLKEPFFSNEKIPCHYGPFKNSYVLLSVCESGGISLEWYKTKFIEEKSFVEIDKILESRNTFNNLIFLPYITGVNAPEYNGEMRGVFYGINLNHDKYDFAAAVMEGVSHLLKKNINLFEKTGINTSEIISTGGGAKSRYWTQIKADVTDYKIAIPENQEAACFGAAIIAAVAGNIFSSYEDAVIKTVSIKHYVKPQTEQTLKNYYSKKHKIFNQLYRQISSVYHNEVIN